MFGIGSQKITPCLWFGGNAEDAAQFYTSVFKDGGILDVQRYGEGSPGEPGSVMTVTFEIEGQRFIGLNGGPDFRFTEAISFFVTCQDQAEVDYFWEKLTEGGEESQCGWLKDRFGVSWQIVPEGFGDYITDPDPERAKRAMQAMLQMRKLDINAIKAAADGVPAQSA